MTPSEPRCSDILLRHRRDAKHAVHNVNTSTNPGVISSSNTVTDACPSVVAAPDAQCLNMISTNPRIPTPATSTCVFAPGAGPSDTLVSDISDTSYASILPGDASAFVDGVDLDDMFFGLGQDYLSWLPDTDFPLNLPTAAVVTTRPEPRSRPPDLSSVAINTRLRRPMNLKRMWFTHFVEATRSQPETMPSSPDAVQGNVDCMHTDVDERYRQKIHQRLRIYQLEPQLPSTDHLNICIRLYSSRFHPVFPIVHIPTFRPSRANTAILIAMCFVGSLFTGSEDLIRMGYQLFERLCKATLVNWVKLVTRSPGEVISIVQAALISELFGLLTGNPNHLTSVFAFHGPPIALARRQGIFNARPLPDLDLHVEGPELDKKWRQWARNEEMMRISLGLYILDAEIANMLYHEPLLPFSPKRLPNASSNSVFFASNAEHWRTKYLNEFHTQAHDRPSLRSVADTPRSLNVSLVPASSNFTAYAVLEGINVHIPELKSNMTISSVGIQDIEDQLNAFYPRFLSGTPQAESDPLQMRILWHAAFMNIFADFDVLEKAIGREGPHLAPADQVLVTKWASSEDAKRSLLHGLMVKKRVEASTLGSEPAIHVAIALFRAGIAWFCYMTFTEWDQVARNSMFSNHNLQELKLFATDPTALLFEANEYINGGCGAHGPLPVLVDLLRRFGHWEIAQKLAAILAALMTGGTDNSGSDDLPSEESWAF
jgi:hypothetical protein